MNLEDILLVGTRASQPVATSVAEGTLYSVTDEGNLVEQSRAGAWITYAGGGSGGGGSSSLGSGISFPLPIDGEDGYEGIIGNPGPIGPAGAAGASGSSFLAPFTKPLSSSFTWVNQLLATVADDANGIFLRAVDLGGAPLIHAMVVSAPATPYVVTAAFLYQCNFTPFNNWGLCFRNAGAGSFALLAIQAISASGKPFKMAANKYTNPTTWSADYISADYMPNGVIWLRIADNGVSRICSYSNDGYDWEVFHTIGRTDFLTADQVGFYFSAQSGAVFSIKVLSWLIT